MKKLFALFTIMVSSGSFASSVCTVELAGNTAIYQVRCDGKVIKSVNEDAQNGSWSPGSPDLATKLLKELVDQGYSIASQGKSWTLIKK